MSNQSFSIAKCEQEQNGFSDIATNYALIDLTPDEPKYSAKMIEAMRQNDLEAIELARRASAEKAISAVNAKYDERLRLYRVGQKQWDTSVSVTLIVRGIKRKVSDCRHF